MIKKVFKKLLFLLLFLLLSCGGTDNTNGKQLIDPPDKIKAPKITGYLPGERNIELHWDHEEDLSFKVYYGRASRNYECQSAFEGPSPITVDSKDIKLTGLQNGVEYFISISAVKDDNESNLSEEISASPEHVFNPPATPQITGVTGGDGTITVDWSGVEGAETYLIHLGESPGVHYSYWGFGNNYRSWTRDGFINGTTYYIAISAMNAYQESSPKSSDWAVTPNP